ncbi:single-stranded DNA-binding protein [uncultured Clostridium sp.]|uniref:single-stranded DNA-binding protein n=1 Tax=uncultured Clostridium sp. TaxID=59620 RepID=UPI0027DB67CD|nr:single-stranded DNA-binding protein [uncultured Clostridium sp.]
MNKVFLIGRLAKDPKLDFTSNTQVSAVKIILAVDKYNAKTEEKKADFISVIIFGKQAEATATYLNKGNSIAILGRIRTRTYEDKENNKHFIVEVVAEPMGVKFLNNKHSKSMSNEEIQEIKSIMEESEKIMEEYNLMDRDNY